MNVTRSGPVGYCNAEGGSGGTDGVGEGENNRKEKYHESDGRD
jgi:hypothetical protein